MLKAKRISSKIIIGGVILASPLLMTACNKNKNPGSQEEDVQKDKSVKVGNKTYSEIEYNFYFKNFVETFRTMIGPEDDIKLDFSKSLASQEYKDGKTWEEFFKESTDNMILEIEALKIIGEEKKYNIDKEKLFDEYYKTIEEAAEREMTKPDVILSSRFGEGANKENIKEAAINLLEASQIKEKITKEYKPSKKEINDIYEKEKDDIDRIYYRQVNFSENEGLDFSDEKKTPTKEEQAEAAKKAKERAEKALSEVKTEEDMKKLSDEIDGVNKDYPDDDYSLQDGIYKFEMLKPHAEWLFDKDRKAGDITLIYNDGQESYSLLYFKERKRPDEPTLDIRQLVINTGMDPNLGEKDFKTKEEYEKYVQELKEKRTNLQIRTAEILDKWAKGDKNREHFETLINDYGTEDAKNVSFYQNQPKENFVPDIGDWAFSEDRKTGDMKAFMAENYTTFIYIDSINGPLWESVTGRKAQIENTQKVIDAKIKEMPGSKKGSK